MFLRKNGTIALSFPQQKTRCSWQLFYANQLSNIHKFCHCILFKYVKTYLLHISKWIYCDAYSEKSLDPSHSTKMLNQHQPETKKDSYSSEKHFCTLGNNNKKNKQTNKQTKLSCSMAGQPFQVGLRWSA